MCGRFTLKTPVIEWLCSLFPDPTGDPNSPGSRGLSGSDVLQTSHRSSWESLAGTIQRANPLLAAARYNISPTQPIWGITQKRGDSLSSPHELNIFGHPIRMLRWGLIPSWADSMKVAYSMINARSETLFEKPSFKNLTHSHRCIIVADGYYEWQRPTDDAASATHKQPYWIHRPEEKPFAMAGLWTENKKVQPNQVLQSATIITTEANADTSQVHDRMPVLLPDPQSISRWLAADTDPKEITAMLVPAQPGLLQIRAVSSQVNSPRHDGQQLIEALSDQT
jgi:putative SOS response-associated peptidase YedK